MSLLPQSILKSVIYIETPNGAWTWFLIWMKNWKNSLEWKAYYDIFIVTNLHIIENCLEFKVFFNQKDGEKTHESIKKEDSQVIYYKGISDRKDKNAVDVVLIHINWEVLNQKRYDWIFITEEQLIWDLKEYSETIKVWQEIFLLWFPLWQTSPWIWKNNFHPLARQGIISRYDEELEQKNQVYLDVNNFPWNSWWPIILKPNAFSLEGNKPLLQAKLIWIIFSYFPFEKIYFDITTIPPTAAMKMQENSWIAIWIPSYIIYEMAKNYMDTKKI